jgi:hypothetical protein
MVRGVAEYDESLKNVETTVASLLSAYLGEN